MSHGVYMRYVSHVMLITIVLPIMLIFVACSNSSKASDGVAKIDAPQKPEQNLITPKINTENTQVNKSDNIVVSIESEEAIEPLTDEEITTQFVVCMRGHGFDIPDPELNSDGTIRFAEIRQSIAQDPKFDMQSNETIKAFEECVPILEGASFAPAPSPEDEIEFQDNLLGLAECLRENGVNVPDPDFSNGSRVAMISMFQGINSDRNSVQETIRMCGEQNFGGNLRRQR